MAKSPRLTRQRFEMTLVVSFDRSVPDTEQMLSAETDAVHSAVGNALSSDVPKQKRTNVSVQMTRASVVPRPVVESDE